MRTKVVAASASINAFLPAAIRCRHLPTLGVSRGISQGVGTEVTDLQLLIVLHKILIGHPSNPEHGHCLTHSCQAPLTTTYDCLALFCLITQAQPAASSRLTHLHWLPVRRHIQYKLALLTYNILSTSQPPYLRNLLHMYQPSRCLHSASQNLLSIPFCATNFGKRSFSFSLLQFGMN